MNSNFEIKVFNNGSVSVEVNFDKENNTVWLTQKQMAEMFDVSTDNIGLHIKNIFRDGELDTSVAEESSVTASDGKKYKTKIYNLDMIISVGYRVKSKVGIIFRKWVTGILNKYLIENDKKILKELNLPNLEYIGSSSFFGCANLDLIFTESKVEYIGANAFVGTNYLDEFDSNNDGQLDDFIVINGTLIKYNGDETNIVLDDSITSISGGAFSGNQNIESITFGKNVTKIASGSLDSCTSLKTIILTGNDVVSLDAGTFDTLSTGLVIKVKKFSGYLYNIMRHCHLFKSKLDLSSIFLHKSAGQIRFGR